MAFLSRLFARYETPPDILAKAETGPGVFSIANYAPLESLSRHPAKLMAEAEALFHENIWVADAERAIVGRYLRAPWHIETSTGDTLDPRKLSGPERVAYDLIAQPSPGRSRHQHQGITLRHIGLTGNAFWYLDQRSALDGIPLQVLYLNPARMTAVENPAGELIGWLLDGRENPAVNDRGPGTPLLLDRGPGTPLLLEEVIHLKLDEPDWGHYGVGIAQAAWAKVLLSKLADRHAAQVLSAGGRLSGILGPKQGVSLSDDAWLSMVRDYRNIIGDPDSAKRLQIVRGPVDFTRTTATPAELQLVELMEADRDSIMAAWGVPLSQIGVMTSGRGMNSGETVKYEEAALWQGAIAHRATSIEAACQKLLDPFGLLYVVDHPAFDDQAPLFINAEKAKGLPLTNDERRALVGYDPLTDTGAGAAILIDQTMTPLETEVRDPQPVYGSFAAPVAEKASVPDELATLRRRVDREFSVPLGKAANTVLSRMSRDIASRVESGYDHLLTKPSDAAIWWNGQRWRDSLADALRPYWRGIAHTVAPAAAGRLAGAKATDGYIDRTIGYIESRGLDRISLMLNGYRNDLEAAIVAGVSAGDGAIALAARVMAVAPIEEWRAEMIGRTETMFAYNEAALATYRDFGVERVVAIDGDEDAECAARNGQEYSALEASAITDHPNGTLDWLPIAPAFGKAADSESAIGGPGLLVAMKALLEYADRPVDIPAPIVNIAAPPTPEVKVTVDSSAFARSLDQLKESLRTPVAPVLIRRVVERDERGAITGVREVLDGA